MKTERKHLYRLPPCPDWAAAGTEIWLTEMAARGWHLSDFGFFLCFAGFEKGAAKSVRYRLAAAQKPVGAFSEADSPDEEQQDIAAALGWEYAGRRGQFYIYRTEDASARELNTDDAVQALAVKAVKKRKLNSLITLVFWLIFYPFAVARGGIVQTMLAVRSWFFLLITAAVLWLLADALRAVIGLGHLQKALQHGEEIVQTRRSRWRHPAKNLAQAALIVVLVCILLCRWSDTVAHKGEIPLADCSAAVPFSTLTDFAGAGASDYRMTMPEFSHISEWTDLLAPRNIDYSEYAAITCADGSVLDGGVHIYYHETAAPFLARLLALEYARSDRRDSGYEPLDIPLPDTDYASACRTVLHVPTVVLQEGNIVIRAFFLQSGNRAKIPAEVWAAQLAESIR